MKDIGGRLVKFKENGTAYNGAVYRVKGKFKYFKIKFSHPYRIRTQFLKESNQAKWKTMEVNQLTCLD